MTFEKQIIQNETILNEIISEETRGCKKASCSGEQGSKDYSANVGVSHGNGGSGC